MRIRSIKTCRKGEFLPENARRKKLISKLTNQLHAAGLLGLRWAGYRAFYAIQCKLGCFQRKTPVKPWGKIPLKWKGGEISPIGWNSIDYRKWLDSYPLEREQLLEQADELLEGRMRWYFYHELSVPDDWHQNPFTKERVPSDLHWSRISEFGYGDVKHIWEPARFAWALTLMRAFWATEDQKYAAKFWEIFNSWYEQNPPNAGIHWKCGQEIAIRSMSLCFVFHGLMHSRESSEVRLDRIRSVILESGKRIAANLKYAYSQKNNHGTSEAAGLFVIGCLFPAIPEAKEWQELGAQGLVSQMMELVYDDGTFSQHSINYHRVMMQTVGLAITSSRIVSYRFPDAMLDKFSRAANWLTEYVDPKTGLSPMCGHNDGALVLPLSSTDFLDLRPIAQASFCIANSETFFDSGAWDEEMNWMYQGEEISSHAKNTNRYPRCTELMDHVVLRNGRITVFVRATEEYKHRPARADQLHVDIFVDGIPILSSSGTYSYNDKHYTSWFASTAANSTVCIDGRDQMPKISRFLYDNWRGVQREKLHENSFDFKFVDYLGGVHARTVLLEECMVRIVDRVENFEHSADILWHVNPAMNVQIDKDVIHLGPLLLKSNYSIAVKCGWCSRYYFEKQASKVLSIKVLEPAKYAVSEFYLRNAA